MHIHLTRVMSHFKCINLFLFQPIEIVNPYERDRKVCILCKYGIKLDYKNPKLLSQFVSPFTGQIYEQHITRLCSKQQAILKNEIKKSITAGKGFFLIFISFDLSTQPQCYKWASIVV